jgi:uncharacterized protein (UPF0333 family)
MAGTTGSVRQGAVTARSAKRASPLVIVIAVVALLAFLGWQGYRNFSYHAIEAPGTAQTDAWLRQKARESGGDITKLSSADQKKLWKLNGPLGAVVLKAKAGK